MPNKISIIGIPYDEKSSYLRGPGEAPKKIREALNSPSSNLWTETGFDLGEEGTLADLGDIDCRSSHESLHRANNTHPV